MRAAYLPEWGAFIRCQDLPGFDPPRVYLHGIARAAGPAFAHIATRPPLNGRRSLLVDFLGFGYSDKPADFSYTMEHHAASVIKLLNELGVQRCDLIGHSMGGSVAILIAAERPDLVSGLVIAEANLDPGAGPMTGAIIRHSEEDYVHHVYAEDVAAQQKRAREGDSPLLGVVLGMYQVAAPWAIHRSARSLCEARKPTFREHFLELAMPRAFLVGSKTLEADPSSSPDAGAGLEEAGIRRIIVPDAGHPMMYQNPDGFAQAIGTALNSPR
jgi:pimeloyl-ACP methyl ester carboxylesterase